MRLTQLFTLTSLFIYFSVVCFAKSESLVTYVEHIPPYTCFENRETTGIAVEIIQLSARHINYDVSFELVPWVRAMKEAKSREHVLLAVLNRTNNRENNFHWLFQLDEEGPVYWLWQLKDSTLENITHASQLNGKRFAYTRSSILLENFQDFLLQNDVSVSMYEVSNREQVFRMLLAKRVDYISAGEEEVFLELAKYGIPNDSLQKVIPIPRTSKGLYIAVGKRFNEQLRKELQLAISKIRESGTIDLIYQRYANTPELCQAP